MRKICGKFGKFETLKLEHNRYILKMTASILPEFILKLLENEMMNATLEIVEYLCIEYSLPFEEVKSKLSKHMAITFNADTTKSFKVTKKNKRLIKIHPDERCVANMFNVDHKCITQCTLKRVCASEYCTVHKRMVAMGRLRFGTIYKPIHNAPPNPILGVNE